MAAAAEPVALNEATKERKTNKNPKRCQCNSVRNENENENESVQQKTRSKELTKCE